ncbi:MAG: dTDP-4-dehydrorhamnose reductase [Muribaculaceae bacterium]|nr:dTDP-4-dehydrorhamnose reductase [Muribaculaceae bacterium]
MSKPRKILITGSAGQLGSELSALMQDDSAFCVTSAPHRMLDVTSEASWRQVLQAVRPDIVVNCAAYTAVDRAESDADAATAVNATAPGILARTAPEGTRIIHISTDYVFDGAADRPYTEDDAPAPLSVYGRTKLLGERALLSERPDSMVIRTGWLYSAHNRNFLTTMLDLARQGRALAVVDDQTGVPTAAPGLARAIAGICRAGIIAGTYHYSAAGQATWYGFAREIFSLAGLSPQLTPTTTEAYGAPAPRPRYSVLDTSRIRAAYDIDLPTWQQELRTILQQR